MDNNNLNLESHTSINIYSVQVCKIYNFWQKRPLPGNFWRLYCHNDKGAFLSSKNRRVDLSPDSLYMIRANSTFVGSCENPDVEQLYVHFSGNLFLGKSTQEYFEIPLDLTMKSILKKLYSLIDEHEKFSRIHLLAASLVSYAADLLPNNVFTDEDLDKRIVKLCNTIESNLQNDFSINELASKMNFAPNAFIRWFKANMNQTPYQYLLQARYSQAAYFLENSDIPIKDICTQIGIKDRFHFSRCFKTMYGVTPATYRKITKKNNRRLKINEE